MSLLQPPWTFHQEHVKLEPTCILCVPQAAKTQAPATLQELFAWICQQYPEAHILLTLEITRHALKENIVSISLTSSALQAPMKPI